MAAGTYVDVHIADVPAEAAAAVTARVDASQRGDTPPLVATGLLQHETKLSIVNFALCKAASYTEPIANKQPLLFVAGFRCPAFLLR